jgi:TPR repeat protein
MGCWVALFLVMLRTGYVEAPHPGNSIRFWAKAAEENRPTARKNLMRMLNYLDQQNLHDPSLAVEAFGVAGPQTREQILGAMCNQAGAIYAEGKVIKADLAKACHYFSQACNFGNLDGCVNLAAQYVMFDRPEAESAAGSALAKLESASAGKTDGQISYLLGHAYDIGRGRTVDKAKARQFYEQSAALEFVEAYQKVGRMQFDGEGGPPDYASAARWLQKAADAQDGLSCLYLARLYHLGQGVPKDEQRSRALLEKACALGIQPACELLRTQ